MDSFHDLDDAFYWLEHNITELHYDGHEDIKGEIIFVNNQWRVSVMTETAQGELFD